MEGNKLLLGVAQSASYNIFIQIFFRVQTFFLNGFILRFISKDVLGIINVRLVLLYSTITFLSTEAFKNASIAKTENQNWRQIINLLWLTIPTAAVCSVFLGYVWMFVLEQPESSLSYQYVIAVCTVCVCCVLERLAEPVYVVTQIFLFNKLKAFLQCISIAMQCGIFAAVVYSSPHYALLGFCIGQAARSLLWTVILYGYFIFYFKNNKLDSFTSVKDFLPTVMGPEEPNFGSNRLALTISFFKQGILKQMLTEGERYVMTIFNVIDFANQGVFDVVSNLGSMAARFIFRPIEESSYQFFAQSIERDKPLLQQNQDSVEMAAQVLRHLLKVMTLIGLVALAFGYSYSFLVLHMYGGSLLSSGPGPTLLRWHCLYILLLAVNGISEGFAFATMNKKDIDRFNFYMIYISIAFLVISYYLTPIFGSVGLILANCANMMLRIAHSIYFIARLFKGSVRNPLRGLIPHPGILVALISSFIITTYAESIFCCSHFLPILIHVGIGVVCLAAVGITVCLLEKELLDFTLQTWRKRHELKTE